MILTDKPRFLNLYRRYYIFIYLSFLFIRIIVPFSNTIPGSVDQLFFTLLSMGGLFYIIYDMFFVHNSIKTKYMPFLILFLLCMVITSLLNIQYGFFDNFKTIIWCAIQFFVFYSVVFDRDKREVLSEVKLYSNFTIIVWFILSFTALIMYILQIHTTVVSTATGLNLRQGFVDNRLFGLYRDPNYAAITSVVTILFSILNYRMIKNKIFRLFYIVNIVIQYFYIILSGSRTAYLSSVIVLTMGSFLFFFQYFRKKSTKWWLIPVNIVLSVAIVISFVLTTSVTQKGLSYIPYVIDKACGIHDTQISVDLVRTDVADNEDMSNHRFEIWSSGLTIFESRPILGVSPRNVLNYATKNFPNLYLVQKKYQLHNGYLDVLVETGVIGFGIMLLFIISILSLIIKYFFTQKLKNNYFITSMCILTLLSIAVSACFICEIFFTNTIGTSLFWLFLGYLLYFIFNDDENLYSKETRIDIFTKKMQNRLLKNRNV